MVNKEGWWLVQQTVLSSIPEMQEPLHFIDFPNVTIALEFKPKSKPKPTNPPSGLKKLKLLNSKYEHEIAKIANYLRLSGMFKLEENNTISTYLDINDDLYTFKDYPISDSIRFNKKGNFELVLDTNATSLLGSEHTAEPMKIVNSKYHLSVNLLGLHKDAY